MRVCEGACVCVRVIHMQCGIEKRVTVCRQYVLYHPVCHSCINGALQKTSETKDPKPKNVNLVSWLLECPAVV